MIKFKFDVAKALETAGMTAYKAQKSGVISQDTWRKIKNNDASINMQSLNNICMILKMQPEHLIYCDNNDERAAEKIKKFNEL